MGSRMARSNARDEGAMREHVAPGASFVDAHQRRAV
jgi:hypothetical protein